VPLSASLAPNTTYWIAYNSSGSADNLYFVGNSAGSYTFSGQVQFGTWPATFPGSSFNGTPAYLLNAVLAGAASSTATATTTPTTTPVPSFTKTATATRTPLPATTTKLLSTLDPVLVGQQVTFTATAGGSGSTPTGSATLGSAALINGVATFSTSRLVVGTHSITAAFGGSTSYAASSGTTSEIVNPR
jgi:hypothetical protein